MTDQGILIRQLQGAVFGAPVTVLPADPNDGKVVDFLADATKGIVWRFKYRAGSASAYKWEFVGGPGLHAARGGSTAITTSGTPGTWVAITSLSLTLPLDGDFDIEHYANVQTTGAGALTEFKLIPFVGGALPGTADNQGTDGGHAAQFHTHSHASKFRVTGKSAGAVVDLRHSSPTASVAATIYESRLLVTPVRVG